MPNVQRHQEVEEWFYDVARTYLTRKPRKGVHVSDLLTPRKAYWARVQPKPPSNREVIFFLAGRGHEEAFVAMAGLSGYHKSSGEWLGPGGEYKPGDGIRYEIDVLTGRDGTGQEIPIEIKTNRRPTIPGPDKVLEEYSIAVEQLGMYSAIKGLGTAYLVEVHLMARNLALKDGAKEGQEADEDATGQEVDQYAWIRESNPAMVVYQIDWSADELRAMQAKMVASRSLLESALSKGDHTILPECPEWMCGKEHIRESDPYCPSCGVVHQNRRMRKCETCKDGRGRVELKRDTQVVFVPTCRWWSSCLPEQWRQHHADYFRPAREDEPDATPPG